jgi:hypothetical protein
MPKPGKSPVPHSRKHDKVDPRELFARDPKQAESDDMPKRAPRKAPARKVRR